MRHDLWSPQKSSSKWRKCSRCGDDGKRERRPMGGVARSVASGMARGNMRAVAA